MKVHIQSAFWAGIVCGAIFAGFDCNFLLYGTGAFWLRLESVFRPSLIYLLLGAFVGGILGLFWSILKRAAQDNRESLLRGKVIFFTFASFVIFGFFYLYDYEFRQSPRGELLHYLLVIPCGLVVSILTWLATRFLLYLLRRKKKRIILATGSLVAIILLEIIVVRFFFPG